MIKFRTKANFSWTGSTLFELYIVLCLLLLINIAWHLCVGRYLDCNVFFLTHQFFRFFIWDSVANFKMIWMNEIFWLSFKRTRHYGTHESILIRILFIKNRLLDPLCIKFFKNYDILISWNSRKIFNLWLLLTHFK